MRMTGPTAAALHVMLKRPDEPYHGLRLHQEAGVALGSIYPLLNRLESEGWVTAEWEVRETGHPRKLYKLTEQGRRSAALAVQRWERRAPVRVRVRPL